MLSPPGSAPPQPGPNAPAPPGPHAPPGFPQQGPPSHAQQDPGHHDPQGYPGQQGHPGGPMPGGPSYGAGMGDGRPVGNTGPWTAVIAPDREYFMAMMNRSGPEAAALNLPAYGAEHELPLTGQQITIGRRRQSTGEAPDIDLGRTPEDPGVSHQHAVLVAQPDGGWSVVDQDSTNGTTINGGEDPIQPFVPVPLREGDRVHVGAWTTITLRRG